MALHVVCVHLFEFNYDGSKLILFLLNFIRLTAVYKETYGISSNKL